MSKDAWTTVTLGDIAENISVRVDDPSKSGLDRFVGLVHLDSGSVTVSRWDSAESVTSSMKRFQAGDVLLARRNAHLRRASAVDFEGVCSGDAYVLREKPDAIVPGLLKYILNTNRFWEYAIANADGSMSTRVKWKNLEKLSIALPPTKTQENWVDILERSNELRFCNSNNLKNAQNLLKCGIAHMNKSLSYSKNTERTLKEIAFFRRGHDLAKRKRVEGPIPIYGANGITDYHNEYVSNGPGVMTGRSGTIGKLHFCEGPYWPLNTSLYVEDFFGNDPKFVFFLLHQINFSQFGAASAVPTLNRNDLFRLKFRIPSTDKQKELANNLTMIEQLCESFNNILIRTLDVQNILINRLLGGMI